jgi:hypothetical protein
VGRSGFRLQREGGAPLARHERRWPLRPIGPGGPASLLSGRRCSSRCRYCGTLGGQGEPMRACEARPAAPPRRTRSRSSLARRHGGGGTAGALPRRLPAGECRAAGVHCIAASPSKGHKETLDAHRCPDEVFLRRTFMLQPAPKPLHAHWAPVGGPVAEITAGLVTSEASSRRRAPAANIVPQGHRHHPVVIHCPGPGLDFSLGTGLWAIMMGCGTGCRRHGRLQLDQLQALRHSNTGMNHTATVIVK